jgi:hypothetical protein
MEANRPASLGTSVEGDSPRPGVGVFGWRAPMNKEKKNDTYHSQYL